MTILYLLLVLLTEFTFSWGALLLVLLVDWVLGELDVQYEEE